MVYFVIGYIMLAGIFYLAYLALTWRCRFCRIESEITSDVEEASPPKSLSPSPPDCSVKQVTPVEVIPPRWYVETLASALKDWKYNPYYLPSLLVSAGRELRARS